MTKNQGDGNGRETGLRKATDFNDQIKGELGLPEVDDILKELQRKHGVRIGLSPNMVKRLEEAKNAAADPTTLKIGCYGTDICVLCDQNDYCPTCDSMDWCISVDTHLA